MAEEFNLRIFVTVEELLISGIFENAALIELLDRKGLVSKEEIFDKI